MNKRNHEDRKNVEGMLLYPTTTEDFSYDLSLHGNRLQVVSINLNQNWMKIEDDLKALLSKELYSAPLTLAQ